MNSPEKAQTVDLTIPIEVSVQLPKELHLPDGTKVGLETTSPQAFSYPVALKVPVPQVNVDAAVKIAVKEAQDEARQIIKNLEDQLKQADKNANERIKAIMASTEQAAKEEVAKMRKALEHERDQALKQSAEANEKRMREFQAVAAAELEEAVRLERVAAEQQIEALKAPHSASKEVTQTTTSKTSGEEVTPALVETKLSSTPKNKVVPAAGFGQEHPTLAGMVLDPKPSIKKESKDQKKQKEEAKSEVAKAPELPALEDEIQIPPELPPIIEEEIEEPQPPESIGLPRDLPDPLPAEMHPRLPPKLPPNLQLNESKRIAHDKLAYIHDYIQSVLKQSKPDRISAFYLDDFDECDAASLRDIQRLVEQAVYATKEYIDPESGLYRGFWAWRASR